MTKEEQDRQKYVQSFKIICGCGAVLDNVKHKDLVAIGENILYQHIHCQNCGKTHSITTLDLQEADTW